MPIRKNLTELIRFLETLKSDADLMSSVDKFIELAHKCFASGGRILCCGNGGSLSQADHFAEECVGRFREDRPPLPALSLSNASEITCIANDFGFEQIFARQIDAHGRSGDLLLLLSTSGQSQNVIEAARSAREKGICTAALVGKSGGALANEVDLVMHVASNAHSDRIQEAHLVILHSMVEGIERRLFPGLYGDPAAADDVALAQGFSYDG